MLLVTLVCFSVSLSKCFLWERCMKIIHCMSSSQIPSVIIMTFYRSRHFVYIFQLKNYSLKRQHLANFPHYFLYQISKFTVIQTSMWTIYSFLSSFPAGSIFPLLLQLLDFLHFAFDPLLCMKDFQTFYSRSQKKCLICHNWNMDFVISMQTHQRAKSKVLKQIKAQERGHLSPFMPPCFKG